MVNLKRIEDKIATVNLEKLLWEMLDEDKETRIVAGVTLGRMRQQKYYELDAFKSEIRQTVDSMGTQRKKFIRALLQSFGQPMSLDAQFGKWVVFDSLDVAFLDAPDLVATLIQGSHMRDAVRRIGPPAKEFIPLVRRIGDASTLAALIREDKEEIEKILLQLENYDHKMVFFSFRVLKYLGPTAQSHIPNALYRIKKATKHVPWRPDSMESLASVGRHDSESLDILLNLMADYPGVVIDSLSYFTDFSEKVVPILISALDTFEEYDPDWQREGVYARIVSTLTHFGAKGAEAVEPLLSLLVQEAREEEAIGYLIYCLGNMGPAAKAALPYLENLCEMEEENPEDYFPGAQPYAEAVARIRGKPGPRDSWKVPEL
jgi:hypothetical protein